jgi:hypothetical protein
MQTTRKLTLCLAVATLLGLGGAAHAGKITAVRVEPATIVAGGQAKVTVEGEDEGICALRVEYGNGEVDVVRMQKDKDNFPRTFVHIYNKPGTYTVVAKGGRDGMILGCVANLTTTLVVTAPPPPMNRPPMDPPQARIRPACPDGFVLNPASVNRRTGAFSCSARKGAQLPQSGLPCPPNTAYYTNTQGTLLGCKALPAVRQ